MHGKLSLVWFVLLLSITNYSNGKNKTPIDIQLNTFNEIPKEVDGNCSGYFYKSANDKKKNKYIIVTEDKGDNADHNFAYLKIGNKLEKFFEIKFHSYVKGKKYYTIYQNQDKSIELRIDIKNSKQQGSEKSTISGTIIIQTANGQKMTLDFIGDFEC